MIKKILKWFTLVLTAVIVLGGSFAAHEWYADKPFFFRAYLDRAMVRMAFSNPETLTSLGFLESVGINGHNAELADVHPDRTTEMFASLRELRQGLLQYEDEDLDESQRMTKELVLNLLDMVGEAERFRYHYYPANQMFGIQSSFPSFMESKHRVNSLEDAQHYLARLGKLETKFDQYLIDLRLREENGIIPPRFVVDRVIDQMTDFVNTAPEENILYTSLADKLDEVEDLTATERSNVLDDARREIIANVYPAYQKFIDYFTELAPRAGDDHGYWHLPDGDEAYRLALRFFTTTDMTADEIHNLGLLEVDRIQAEMLQIFDTLGIDTSLGYKKAMTDFAADPGFYYPDNDAGRAQILVDYQVILDEIDAGIDAAFNIRPEAGMEVVRIPEFKEETSPGAYYEPPSLDGSRPGRFYANLYDIRATPRYSMRTLAYHEGIPGHHFQIAIAMELEGMPMIRKFAPYTGYVEGWALYTEYLAWELGFHDNPEDNIGRLDDELLRAVRLVVDTGIHHKRWTREEAIDYMLANTGKAESDVIAEVERYIVMPGQATAYKVGMMKILELREKARTALGSKFDIRDFHDAVLKNGAVPLDFLERIIDDYIEDTLAGQAG